MAVRTDFRCNLHLLLLTRADWCFESPSKSGHVHCRISHFSSVPQRNALGHVRFHQNAFESIIRRCVAQILPASYNKQQQQKCSVSSATFLISVCTVSQWQDSFCAVQCRTEPLRNCKGYKRRTDWCLSGRSTA
jgi:hypothetical protein